MRCAARVDRNQAEVVQALRKVGASVQLLHQVGGGCPDIGVGFRGHTYLLEIKAEGGRLTEDEREWHQQWRGRMHSRGVGVSTVSKALRLVRLMQLFEQRSWTRRELAEELGVSMRTIERDMADLRAEPFYVPLWYDDGRWHLLRDGGWRAPRCGALQSERARGG